MSTRLLPLLPLALLLLQCHKRDPDPASASPTDPLAALPPETQTGAGTFGCLVNGKPYYTSFSAHGDWQGIDRLVIGADSYLNGQLTAQRFTIHTLLSGSLLPLL